MGTMTKLLSLGLKAPEIAKLDKAVADTAEIIKTLPENFTRQELNQALEKKGISKDIQKEIGLSDKLGKRRKFTKTEITKHVKDLQANIRPNGVTPEERVARAKAQGYGKPLVHGSASDITEFEASKDGRFGPGVYLTKDAKRAEGFANRAAVKETGNAQDATGQVLYPVTVRGEPVVDYADRSEVVANPEQVRSINAEFNPDRQKSKKLLAGAAGAAAVAGATSNPDNTEASPVSAAENLIAKGVNKGARTALDSSENLDQNASSTPIEQTPEQAAARVQTIQNLLANNVKATDIMETLQDKLGSEQASSLMLKALEPRIQKLKDQGVSEDQINEVLATHGLQIPEQSSPVTSGDQPESSSLPPSLEPQAGQLSSEQVDLIPMGSSARLPGFGKPLGIAKGVSDFVDKEINTPDLTLPDGSSLRDAIAEVNSFTSSYGTDFDSIIGTTGLAPEARAKAIKAKKQANQILAATLKTKGLDFQEITPEGEVIALDENGKPVKYDENMLDSLFAHAYEYVGLAMGARIGGTIGAASPIPGGAAIGTALGGAIGAGLGRGPDVIRNAMLANYQVDTADVLARMNDAGVATLTLDALGLSALALAKGTSKGIRTTGRGLRRAYDLFIKGNKEGAQQTLLNVLNLSEDKAVNLIQKWEQVTGNKVLSEEAKQTGKLTAEDADATLRVLSETVPGAQTIVARAADEAKAGGAKLAASINARAQDVAEATSHITSDNVDAVIREHLGNYVEKTKTFFEETKKAGIESMKDTPYTFNFDATALLPAMQKAAKGIVNPSTRKEFYNYVELIRDAGGVPVGTSTKEIAKKKAATTAARSEVTALRAQKTELRTKMQAAKTKARTYKTKKAKDRALAEAADLAKQILQIDKQIVKATEAVTAKAKETSAALKTVTKPVQTSEARSFEDLLKLKAVLNELSSDTRFKRFTDFEQMKAARESVDKEIARAALTHMPEGKTWLNSWKAANTEYHKMKNLEKNSLYKALTAPEASLDSAIKAITKSMSYTGPETFMQVLGKLPARTRANVEGGILKHLVDKHKVGFEGGNEAINFPKLADELDKLAFTQPEARDMKRTIKQMAEVFKNDVHLLNSTGAVPLPKFQSYLTADPIIRAKFEFASTMFNAIKSRLPFSTNAGRAALVKNLGRLLDNPLNNKTIIELKKELPDDPELATALHQLANEYAKFGKPEHYGKVPIYRVYKPGSFNTASNTMIGRGVLYYTNKAKAREIAKQTGAKVQEVFRPHQTIATPETVAKIIGREPTSTDFKDPEVLDQLQKAEYVGLAVGDKVVLFK